MISITHRSLGSKPRIYQVYDMTGLIVGLVVANTKSEARAAWKDHTGLPVPSSFRFARSPGGK
jgi:hypothetical protein